MIGEEFAKRSLNDKPVCLVELEAELLNGQKLQGPGTAAEVFGSIESRGLHDR